MDTHKPGSIDPQYGGVITDISTLPAGTTFFVTNGCWKGQIVEKNGALHVMVMNDPHEISANRRRVKQLTKLYPTGDERNLLSITDIHYPADKVPANRKTIVLDSGKYTVVYDESGSYPKKCLRNGEPWRDLTGDNLIFWLCAELEKSRQNRREDDAPDEDEDTSDCTQTTELFRAGKDWSVTVPVLENLERRFGFVTVQSDSKPASFLLLGQLKLVILEDGTLCWGAYAVQELDDACVPFGEVVLLTWKNKSDLVGPKEPDRVIPMSEFLFEGEEN